MILCGKHGTIAAGFVDHCPECEAEKAAKKLLRRLRRLLKGGTE